VLDLCSSAAHLPSLRLRWHYRSQHDSLITFSNHRFYADQPLLVFPAEPRRHLSSEQLLADVVAAARDLSDLVQKLQYGQRVKVIWLRCTSSPLTTLTGTSSRSRLRLTHSRALS
jgi:hypothetical protein